MSLDEMEAHEAAPGTGVWIARDVLGQQHLLVEVPAGVHANTASTHGLGVTVGTRRIAGKPDAHVIDLACLDPAVTGTFSSVAANVLSAVLDLDLKARRDQLMLVLSQWRWFWGVDGSRFSASEATGLFGELWFLLRWAGVTSESVRAWDASNGARHDFQWPERSVEVKVSSRSGALVHTVQHLDQLADPETGELYLFSLRLRRDNLAANSLDGLVEAAVNALSDDVVARGDLLEKVAKRGYAPAASGQSSASYRILDESLYRVADGFPRLTEFSFTDGLPNAITNVSYQLDMNACGDWLVGTTSQVWCR
ncbi:PD-(D/E)XK motif protein [Mycolicibacterium sp. Y3]